MRRLTLLLLIASGGWACIAENSVHAPADIRKFRPFKSYPAVLKFAGPGVLLKSIEARYVKSDGTMDLEADYKPRLIYEFVRPHPEKDELPVGAGGGNNFQELKVEIAEPRWKQTVKSRPGVRSSYPAYYRSMTKQYASDRSQRGVTAEGPPRCAIVDMWKEALAQGAPVKGVARITYKPHGYEFRISDTRIRLHYDTSCERIPRSDYRAERRRSFRRRRPGHEEVE